MSDTSPDSNPHRSALDRAREDRRLFPLRGQTWAMSMQMARDARHMRAAVAARGAIGLARTIADESGRPGTVAHGDPMWEVRGEPRTRKTFGHPHPDDFPGGLPLPPDD